MLLVDARQAANPKTAKPNDAGKAEIVDVGSNPSTEWPGTEQAETQPKVHTIYVTATCRPSTRCEKKAA